MTPKRIQRKRTKGWRMPRGAVYVGRPTKWGNPFQVGCNAFGFSTAVPYAVPKTLTEVLEDYRYFANAWMTISNGYWIKPLKGKNLACWCPLSEPCHADVLLELANSEVAQ